MKKILFVCFILFLPLAVHPQALSPAVKTTYIDEVVENQVLEFYQVDEVILINSTFRNVTINIIEVGNVTITGNTFSGQIDVSLNIWRSRGVSIVDNTFLNQPTNPIGIHATTGANIVGNNITITDEPLNEWLLLVGLVVNSSPQTRISNNVVYSPGGDGIYIENSPQALVTNNLIHDTGFIGLSVTLSPNSYFSNNSIVQSSSYGRTHSGKIPQSSAVIFSGSEGAVFKNNTVDGSDNNGIEILSSPNSVIEKNSIKNHAEAGIFIGLSNNVTVRYNSFEGNKVEVETDQSTDLTITGNLGVSDGTTYSSIKPSEQTLSDVPVEGNLFLPILLLAIGLRRRKR